jgi:DNA-binding PadR family transcriptional regulator
MHYHEFTEQYHRKHCAGRHGFERGSGRRFRGRGGRGGDAFRVGKMLADGDLRLIVLALLAQQPRHGYDIIKALEEHSSGFYSPSPGIVYPTLTFLEEAGFATASSEGNKKVYTITEAGLAHLAENQDIVDAALSGIEKIGRKMARARQWLEGSDRRPDRDIPHVAPEVNEARRTLKQAIAEKLDAPPEEQQRVAGILREAAAKIRRSESATASEDDIDLGE